MAEFSALAHRYSDIAGVIPDPSELLPAELAINLTDKRIFTKDAAGNVFDLASTALVFTVPDTTARDAIPTASRAKGMLVYVVAVNFYYTLISGLTNADWLELNVTPKSPIEGGTF